MSIAQLPVFFERTDHESPCKPRCSVCLQRSYCLPAELEGTALAEFERSVTHFKLLTAEQSLVRAGELFQGLYALRSGSLKALNSDAGGEDRVLGYYLPGAVLGLAAQAHGSWSSTLVALEDAQVCRIPLRALDQGLGRRLTELIGKRLRAEYEFHMSLASRSSARRLAALLIKLSDYFRARGLSAVRFNLPMTHKDTASYLVMRQESLSRGFRALRKHGWVRCYGRRVEIADLESLRNFMRA